MPLIRVRSKVVHAHVIRFLKRTEAANGGAEVGLLDEDSCSVSSSDERQLRHSTSAALRPPTSGREGLSAAEAAV
jgi:hypothetical protein